VPSDQTAPTDSSRPVSIRWSQPVTTRWQGFLLIFLGDRRRQPLFCQNLMTCRAHSLAKLAVTILGCCIAALQGSWAGWLRDCRTALES